VEPDRTAFSSRQAKAETLSGTQTALASASADRDSVCVENRYPLGILAARTRLWFGHDLLAALARLASDGSLAENPRTSTRRLARSRPNRLVACGGGQQFRARVARGKKTGPNPTDRAKAGSKHQIITDAQGIPLATLLTSANTNDVTQLIPLVEAIPPVRGKPGRPRQRPESVYGDRGFDSEPHRRTLRARGITPRIAKRNTAHGSGLGIYRWVVERTIAWLHQFRRLRIRYERNPDIHEAFLSLGCSVICSRFL